MKIISWNVNGVRAVVKKDFDACVAQMSPDVLCIQETKAQDDQALEALAAMTNYHVYVNSAVRKGYSGTAILSKNKPIEVSNDIGVEEFDTEGRVITAEFDGFYLVTVYVPNSGSGLARLAHRKAWDKAFQVYLKNLELKKPVVLCGDLNVAHRAIDLKNPKPNYNKTAGYTQDEIDGLDSLIESGFVDTFRFFYPEEIKYSWWSYRFNSRAKNVGWRIDYFLVSQSFTSRLKDAFILNEIHGSDHCPVGIEI